MARLYNGTGGEFWYGDSKVGKVRNWRLDIQRESLDVTSLGEADASYVLGGRSASGSATVLYDSTDAATVELFEGLLSNGTQTVTLKLVIDATDAKYFEFSAVIPSLSTGSSVNEVTSADFQFQVCGEITGSL